jgi:hypothetical protein
MKSAVSERLAEAGDYSLAWSRLVAAVGGLRPGELTVAPAGDGPPPAREGRHADR